MPDYLADATHVIWKMPKALRLIGWSAFGHFAFLGMSERQSVLRGLHTISYRAWTPRRRTTVVQVSQVSFSELYTWQIIASPVLVRRQQQKGLHSASREPHVARWDVQMNASDEAIEDRISEIIAVIRSGQYDSAKANCERVLQDHFDRLKSAADSSKTGIRVQRTARWYKTALRYLEAEWYASGATRRGKRFGWMAAIVPVLPAHGRLQMVVGYFETVKLPIVKRASYMEAYPVLEMQN
jgi:hypothetical protein